MSLPEPAELVPGLDRWRELPAAQQPRWPDPAALDAVLDDVRKRFGYDAITRAVLLGRDPGLSVPLLPD